MAEVIVAEVIGYINCYCCGGEVQLKESKKGKAYYNCKECGQFFSRTQKADEGLRAKARPSKKETDNDGKQEEPERRKTSGWDPF